MVGLDSAGHNDGDTQDKGESTQSSKFSARQHEHLPAWAAGDSLLPRDEASTSPWAPTLPWSLLASSIDKGGGSRDDLESPCKNDRITILCMISMQKALVKHKALAQQRGWSHGLHVLSAKKPRALVAEELVEMLWLLRKQITAGSGKQDVVIVDMTEPELPGAKYCAIDCSKDVHGLLPLIQLAGRHCDRSQAVPVIISNVFAIPTDLMIVPLPWVSEDQRKTYCPCCGSTGHTTPCRSTTS